MTCYCARMASDSDDAATSMFKNNSVYIFK